MIDLLEDDAAFLELSMQMDEPLSDLILRPNNKQTITLTYKPATFVGLIETKADERSIFFRDRYYRLVVTWPVISFGQELPATTRVFSYGSWMDRWSHIAGSNLIFMFPNKRFSFQARGIEYKVEIDD